MLHYMKWVQSGAIKIFSCIIPDVLKKVGSIVHFEAANILLAVRCWCEEFQNKTVLIWCDNWAVVNVFNNYKVRDPLLMAVLRSVWLCYSKYVKSFDLVSKYAYSLKFSVNTRIY